MAYDWTVELAGTDACQTFTASLAYADPEGALPELEEEPDEPLIYRENLRSDADASFGGAGNDCDADLEGAHTISGVDRGSYTLHVALDDGGGLRDRCRDRRPRKHDPRSRWTWATCPARPPLRTVR